MALIGRDASYTADLSSAGVGKYTPLIYAEKTLLKFYKTTVYGEIANTDYEKEIKGSGDKVIIRTVPDVTIRDYVKGQDLVYETPASAAVELEINKAKYFALNIDKIDEAQNDLNLLDKWADDGSKQMAIAVDYDILANTYLDAHSANKGNTAGARSASYDLGSAATPKVITTSNALDVLMDAEAVLSEQNVPEDDDRWIVLPTWYCNMLQKSDLRRADSLGAPDSQNVLRNGKLGKLGQFTIYRSNQVYTSGGNSYITFGHKSSLAFAAQITDSQVIPHPLRFGTIMRSLLVYGHKVIKPEGVGVIVCHK